MASELIHAILLLGAPGTGKGTQGAILGQVPGFVHQSSGDIFRSMDPNSEIGKLFRSFSEKGELVPDDVTIRIWKQDVDRRIAAGTFRPTSDLLVLDGIPRTPSQAKLMNELLKVHSVIHLSCKDEEALVERLRKRAQKQNRPDDAKPDVIRRRLEVYREETRPVLECYDKSIIHKIDPLGTPASVLRDILSVVAPIQADVLGNALA